MEKKIHRCGELAWVLAIILCSLGVSLSAKSGFGVSMVVAPAYVIHLKLSQFSSFFTFGVVEYFLQGIIVILTAVVVRKFKLKYFLSFFTAVIYGYALDLWTLVVGTEASFFWERCLCCVLGAVITAFSIALFLNTYLPQEAYELVIKEICDKFKFNMTKVKWIYDMTSLAVAIILMLALFKTFSFEMIGAGTLILTVINTPLITFFRKLLGRRFVFDSAFPKFYQKFNKIMN